MYGLDDSLTQPPATQLISSGQSTFTLPFSLPSGNAALIEINKVTQFGNYTIVGNILTFDFTVASGAEVLVLPRGRGILKPQTLLYPIANAAGSANVISANYIPQVLSLVDNTIVAFVVSATNTSSTVTFSPDGLAAKAVVNNGDTPLDINQFRVGDTIHVRYSSTLGKWVVVRSSTGGSYFTTRIISAATTLTAADVGKHILCNAGTYSVTLPSPSTLPPGSNFNIESGTGAVITVITPSGTIGGPNNYTPSTSKVLYAGVSCEFVSEPFTPQYRALNGSGAFHKYQITPAGFGSSTVGWEKLPNGKISQFGFLTPNNTGAAAYNVDVTFPIAFPNACISCVFSGVLYAFDLDLPGGNYRVGHTRVIQGIPTTVGCEAQLILADGAYGHNRAAYWNAIGW